MTKRVVIGAIIVVAILVSPWILATAWMAGNTAIGNLDKWRYRPTSEFRPADWKQPNLKYRYSVLDYVASQVVTNGMLRTNVMLVLGKPDHVTEKSAWQFETRRPGFYLIDFSGGGLLVEFDAQDRVVKVSKNLWVD